MRVAVKGKQVADQIGVVDRTGDRSHILARVDGVYV